MSLIGQMQANGLWHAFDRQVVQLEPVLEEMSARGIPIDAERYKAMVALLKADMEKAKQSMQALVPLELKKVKHYKKTPKVCTEAHFKADDGHWCKVEVWKPSNKALTGYMRFRGHPVPKHPTTGDDTTLAIELARLFRSTKDPLYEAVIKYRKAQTCLTNHVKNWKPLAYGKVHPTFYCDPATGQLSARRPNSQNAPHHDDPEFGGYAEPFRAMLIAREGHSLVELDYKSFHVQTLAFEAEDPDLLRLAKLDVHSFVTAHLLKLGNAEKLIALLDDELREQLRWIKKNYKHDRDAKVKHAFLGYDNGMGYKKMFKQYAEYYENEAEAKKVIQLLDGLFPRTKRYRDAICLKAHEQGYLISRHGYIRYFFEVNRVKWVKGRDGKWKEVWSHGDDHEAALCFFTQNDAHGELRDRMVELHRLGLDAKYNLINTVHDSLVFEWPNNLLDEIPAVKGIMESPSKVLVNSICPKGLSVEAEVKIGPDWSCMKEL